MKNFIKITTFLIMILSISYSYASDAPVEGTQSKIDTNKSLKRFLKYSPNDKKAPVYRKVFDEYILDVEYIQKYNKMPHNPKKDEDLAKMNYNGAITLK